MQGTITAGARTINQEYEARQGERTSLIYRLTCTCRRVSGEALSGIIRDEIVITALRDAAATVWLLYDIIKLPINRWRKHVETYIASALARRRVTKCMRIHVGPIS